RSACRGRSTSRPAGPCPVVARRDRAAPGRCRTGTVPHRDGAAPGRCRAARRRVSPGCFRAGVTGSLRCRDDGLEFGRQNGVVENPEMEITMRGMTWIRPVLAGALVAMGGAACGDRGARGDGGLSGSIEVDGSSTVYPITEAVAEEFMLETGRAVQVTVGVSGTGGGFKRFCAGETAISNASRPIKSSEREACEAAGVRYLELPVAYDGIAVVANPSNDFVECLTVEELRRSEEHTS